MGRWRLRQARRLRRLKTRARRMKRMTALMRLCADGVITQAEIREFVILSSWYQANDWTWGTFQGLMASYESVRHGLPSEDFRSAMREGTALAIRDRADA